MLPSSEYKKVHGIASKLLPLVCMSADKTCSIRFECALRKDAPLDLIRTDEKGRRYFIGDPLVGYMRLCASHHHRYDGLWVGRRHTDEARAKIAAAAVGNQKALGNRFTHTDEARAKIAVAGLGNQHTLGYKHTEETKAKMRAAAAARRKLCGL
jgi:hypothetical protein